MSVTGTPARDRALALAILALLIAALWVGPVAAYLNLIAAGADELAGQAALLQRYRALAAAPSDQPPAVPAIAEALLVEAPEAQAVALLQQTVKNAAGASRVQIQSMQVLRSEALAGALRIGVRIRAAGDTAALGRLLYAIETERPVLYPDNLQVQSRPGAGDRTGTLDFQLDVSGFVAGGGS